MHVRVYNVVCMLCVVIFCAQKIVFWNLFQRSLFIQLEMPRITSNLDIMFLCNVTHLQLKFYVICLYLFWDIRYLKNFLYIYCYKRKQYMWWLLHCNVLNNATIWIKQLTVLNFVYQECTLHRMKNIFSFFFFLCNNR